MNYAKGDHSFFICMRSGKKTRQRDGIKEPGTGLLIDKNESDGMWNQKNHPQNKTPRQRLENKPQRFALSGKNEVGLHFLLTESGDYMIDESGQPILIDP